jgi:hypothetical protein
MAGSSSDSPNSQRVWHVLSVSRRSVEVWTAVTCVALGAVVVGESLTHAIGWNETGPGSGYFPFRVGILLIGAAAALGWRRPLGGRDLLEGPGAGSASGPANLSAVFVTGEEFCRTLSVFLPTVVLVGAMRVLGCYVPSAIYLAWMMRRHGGHGWLMSAGYGAAVMVVFFLVFDVWFRVPLAKGPVEAALGLY